MLGFLKRIIGDSNERELRRLRPIVEKINAIEPEFEKLSDAELRAKTDEFKERLEGDETLDDLVPEAFAAVREAAKRTLGQRHFDVQLIGGAVLHQGKIAEMQTGEGKTLVATLPGYLNALLGKGVHVVTVNDYLAKRDTQWMGPIYDLLGISVGCLQHEAAYFFDRSVIPEDERMKHLRPVPRKDAYLADITYGTNNEFGFDYLRDNMVWDLSQCVQRELHYAIVDEVDNILIDEARTPLIISGAAEESTEKYYTFARLVPRFKEVEDYVVDEKMRAVTLTESGISKMEHWLNIPNLYDPENYGLTHYVENALRAQVLFKRDRDYMVKDGEAIIVDEFTGRLMFGRRYADGLHQAIEAKEGLKVQRETVTLATITIQNYFRLYQKLAGMTGTAATEAEEFWKIYKLDVMVIPPNKTLIRTNHPDLVYKTEEAKFKAVAKEIEEWNKQGRPVLVGTVSIEKSERLSGVLTRRGVPHQVLNAKHHEKEAGIVTQAGRIGMVTVATNMAGRGTDIILGGKPDSRDPAEWEAEHNKVVVLGGLHIIGTERHEARRIDNQLRGRAGRQGDPGSSRFYVSLEDDVMRRFGGDRIKTLMEWADLSDDVPIQHGLITKSIENAQIKVEGHNFDIRKHLVEYDDVVNKHREVMYGERQKILSGADLKTNILSMVHEEIKDLVANHLAGAHGDDWDREGLLGAVRTIYPLPPSVNSETLASMSRDEIEKMFISEADRIYEEREKEIGFENMRALERMVMLRIIDTQWVEHLTAMENMRQGIGLHAYGQVDPLIMYKREGHAMYEKLRSRMKQGIVHAIYHVGIAREERPRPKIAVATNRGEAKVPVGAGVARAGAHGRKVGRNDPCPCGSGKKYKKCHGA
ncbi:MAG: preprotein translocase subunit SecA [Chloroflexi bacterium]|nr:preprotein translocase subunit SecA [Chloroflexota bacterium]